jgi:hypothetical protein
MDGANDSGIKTEEKGYAQSALLIEYPQGDGSGFPRITD